jgi:transcription elongation factor Elf1
MAGGYWVDIIREETEINVYSVWIDAESAEQAKERVREHYMGEGDVLTYGEAASEQHSRHLGVEESRVVSIGDVTEGA